METNKRKGMVTGAAVGAGLLAAVAGTVIYFNKRKNIPAGVNAIEDFNLKKYLGKWYEIARMDFHFEKDLNNTTAEYSLNEDGSVKVVNTGYNYKKQREEQSIGRAVFVDEPSIAELKVSFFGPFYAGYNVIALDKKYHYALIAGRNHDYLWILSRETSIPDDIKEEYLKIAQEAGYNTDKLTWVEHYCPIK